MFKGGRRAHARFEIFYSVSVPNIRTKSFMANKKKKLNSITLHKMCVWCIVFRVPATIGLLAACRPMRSKTVQVSCISFAYIRRVDGKMFSIDTITITDCHFKLNLLLISLIELFNPCVHVINSVFSI